MARKINYAAFLKVHKEWMTAHGETLAGYIQHYGDPGIPTADGKDMYGDGGTKIYNADMTELRRLEELSKNPY